MAKGESRHAFRDRLRFNGVWEEFVARRVLYETQGREPSEAHDRAEKEFGRRKYPARSVASGPTTVGSPSGAGEGLPELAVPDPTWFEEKPEVPFLMGVRWVYENLISPDIVYQDCPSLGAYGLLVWARENRDTFYETFVPRMLPSRAQLEEEERTHDDRGPITTLDRLLAIAKECGGREDATLSDGSEGLAGEPAVAEADSNRGIE